MLQLFHLSKSEIIDCALHQRLIKITLAELSRCFSVSEQYITRLFRRHLNTTPTTYIHRVKLENARWLLTHSTMNVTEISDYLGFSGSYYFIRLFKKYYGLTPMQYVGEMLEREYRGTEERLSVLNDEE